MADEDKGTDTSTTYYDAEGNKTGSSESHSEPSSDAIGGLIDETISTVTGGALDDSSDDSDD